MRRRFSASLLDHITENNLIYIYIYIADTTSSCRKHLYNGHSLITGQKVRNIIQNSPNKCCQLDPLSTWLLIKCLIGLNPILTNIVNASLSNVPGSLKSRYYLITKSSYLVRAVNGKNSDGTANSEEITKLRINDLLGTEIKLLNRHKHIRMVFIRIFHKIYFFTYFNFSSYSSIHLVCLNPKRIS